MSNLSLAKDYQTVFTIQGTFSCLLYIFAKLLFCLIILHVFVVCSYFSEYHSFEANSYVLDNPSKWKGLHSDSIIMKEFF